ncbi:MurR/RpiR family transcriptional regulator [Lactovum miscens]|uniref:DNA-binding MurR/RpiR family transcriptional regulator n=1 Tax=Lactovum miscens TaxID=190387 RepID=A0A841C4G2_9LACT|nr:MurR/RpiR family transcriptional regulator [Lactovum miscens]MBB5887305.1 DNA-binding MurR/RpiR family transcriptional regulator [Lactovum miscens]
MSQELSNSERHTWQVIQNHYQEIPRISISEMAEMAYVSISTVNRTVRKKGYAGYSDFRYSVKEKTTTDLKANKFSQEVLNAIQKNEEELLKTINGISANSIEAAVKAIDKANEIIIIACGLSGNPAREMLQKLQLYHKHVSFQNEASSMEYYAQFLNSSDLIIAITLFGETPEINKTIEIAKSHGAKVLTLTAVEDSTANSLTDISLVGYKSRLEVTFFELAVHSRIPLHILVRVLFDSYSIYKNELDRKIPVHQIEATLH